MDRCRYLWDTWFLGRQAVQYWSDFLVWEQFLTCQTEIEIRRVIELGSGNGAFSLFLLLQCVQRGMAFDTFDLTVTAAADTPVGRLLGLAKCCWAGDLWLDDCAAVKHVLANSEHPLLLFCDNGDKPREFRTFVPLLRPGDLIAVHDWGVEFSDASIDATPGLRNLVQEIFVAESTAIGTLTRFYRRIG